MEPDHGPAISYKVLARGTPVLSADGAEVGRVRRVQDNVRENIFDGIVITTSAGDRFVDAPEVARIAERAVTLTITATEAAGLHAPRSQTAPRLGMGTTVQRARRFGRDIRRRWHDR
jgi:hypothetical protein